MEASRSILTVSIKEVHSAPPLPMLRFTQAVEQSDYGHANHLVHELRLHTSPYGNAKKRLAHYFMEALVARMSGTGGQLYSALNNNRPSEGKMLKAQILLCEYCHFAQVPCA